MRTFVVAVLVLACVCDAAIYQMKDLKINSVVNANDNEDEGSLQTCNPAQNFTLLWKPKIIDVSTTSSVSVTFDMVSQYAWSRGQACYDVWLTQYKDPIYSGCNDVDCNAHLPSIVKKFIKCPVTKGAHFYVPWLSFDIPSPIPFPASDYRVRAQLKNPDGSPFLCVEGTITLKDSGYYY